MTHEHTQYNIFKIEKLTGSDRGREYSLAIDAALGAEGLASERLAALEVQCSGLTVCRYARRSAGIAKSEAARRIGGRGERPGEGREAAQCHLNLGTSGR